MPTLVQLQTLVEIEESWVVCHGEPLFTGGGNDSSMDVDLACDSATNRLRRLNSTWSCRLKGMDKSFDYLEPVLALRGVLLQIVRTSQTAGS